VTLKERAGDKIDMDVLKMLADLRQEREQIEEAILTLERLARGRGKRRGRPPAWMSALKRRGRPPGTKNKPKEAAA
jgi:DNA invertase Pin-like site-specific DNA recombinase